MKMSTPTAAGDVTVRHVDGPSAREAGERRESKVFLLARCPSQTRVRR